MRRRTGIGRFLLCSALLVPAIGPSATRAADRPLDGRVVDAQGAGIEGATILLQALGRGATPALTALLDIAAAPSGGPMAALSSAPDGTFSALLPSGRYRVAAFKPGYDADLTDLNTATRNRVELRLREVSRIVLGDLPVGAPGQNLGLDWILRRPPRDVLRQTGASVTGAGGSEAEGSPVAAVFLDGAARPAVPAGGWLAAILQPIDGEFRQDLSGAGLVGGEGSGSGAASGRATSLALKGSIGDQGVWRFDGLTGRSSSSIAAGGARTDQRADRMMVGMDYRLGPGDDLRAEMRYATSRYAVDSEGETVDATDQEQRTIVFHSRWDRRLGTSARLYVDGSYFETGVRTPEGDEALSGLPSGEAGRNRATDRSWLATGVLAFGAGRHDLELGLRTKVYRYEERDRGVLLYNLFDAPTLAEPGESGQAVSLFGSDDWKMTDRSTLNYGLRYHSSLTAGPAYLVPRVGLTRESATPAGVRFRSMVMYRFDDPGLSSLYADRAGRADLDRRDIGRLGYVVGVETRPEDRLQVMATLSYRPFEEGAGGDEDDVLVPGTWGDALLFLTDGAAGRHELLVEMERGFGDIKGSLAGSVGRVEGRLTPAIEEAPVQVLSFGEVRYYKTRLRALYGPTETAVQIDYRRVQGGAGADGRGESGGLDYRRVDLVLTQDLPWLRNVANARFKVLMAYQGLLYGSQSDASQGVTGYYGSGSRLTGGVDISF